MPKQMGVIAALSAVLILPTPALAQKLERVRAGTLTCDIAAGIGSIMSAKKKLACMFVPAQLGPREVYMGSIGKFGPDPGKVTAGEMIWTVYASGNKRFGVLTGHFGTAAEAAVGAGLGSSTLVGGLDRSVGLQPMPLQDDATPNLAAGVAEIDLRPAR